MTSWQISPGTEGLELRDGTAEVVFTVTNPGPVDRRATVEIVSSEQAQSSWFNVAEPQQVIPHGGSKQFVATVKPGENAPAGTHWLAGLVYSADAAPEEDSVTSDRVTFEIKPAPEKPKTKWWLWALIAGVLLAVVVGVVLFLVLRGGPELTTVPPVVGETKAEAEQHIRDRGLIPQVKEEASGTVPRDRVISQSPDGEETVERQSPVIITVSTGPELVPVPPGIIRVPEAAAIDILRRAGLDFSIARMPPFVDPSIPAGFVFASRPSPGDPPVPKGSRVLLLVAN